MAKKDLVKILASVVLSIFAFLVVTETEVSAEPISGTLPHKTDFLTLIQGQPLDSTWYPTKDAATRTTYRNALKSKGYVHSYLSVASGKNRFDGTPHNFYNDPQGFKNLLQELVNDGIKPVVWLTSDTGTWKDKSISAIKTDLTNFVPVVDSLVNSYEVGLEANEYWTKSESDEIGNHLDNLTDKPLASHQTPGKWDYCTSSWCDYMILQYGFGKTTTQIINMTNDARSSLGKPIVAGEYNTNESNPSLSITLGDAALSACAAGFGNGGTPSKIIWPSGSGCGTGSTPTPTPTGLQNQAPVASNASYSVSSGQSVDVIFSFDDPDGPGPYIYTITQQPTKGSLSGSNSDNDWTYTANTGSSGIDTFKWKVNDGKTDSNIATITINIASVVYDGKSYVTWVKNYNKNLSGASVGDFDGNGVVNLLDYRVWINSY
jgi:hypothetical protein